MAAEGLWTVQFGRSSEEHGNLEVSEEINRGGILVLTDNRVYGGGISFYFVGTYEESDIGISMTLNATRYNDIIPGLFNDASETRVLFQGRVDGDNMRLHGHIEDMPNMKLEIEAIRRTTVP